MAMGRIVMGSLCKHPKRNPETGWCPDCMSIVYRISRQKFEEQMALWDKLPPDAWGMFGFEILGGKHDGEDVRKVQGGEV